MEAAALDAYKRLIHPSLETELRGELSDKAAEGAIQVFGDNLRQLLLQPPIRGKVVMGLDPGYRMGCKVAVVDATGRVLDTGVVYPVPEFKKVDQAKAAVKRMIRANGVQLLAIGNGTAGRETEQFAAQVIRELAESDGLHLQYMVVSEAGASVYSASKLAAEEFPQFDVNLRSAVSIARRLQDPLAELVKIDPKAVGVGQYQHDMPQKRLNETLDGVVEDCVNSVGVDLNTASAPLLRRVAGITATTAKNIVARREAEQANAEAEKQLPGLQKKIKDAQGKQNAALDRYMNLSGQAEALDALVSGYRAQEDLKRLYGADSEEYRAAAAASRRRLRGYNEKYGQNLDGGVAAATQYDSVVLEMENALAKANSEGEALNDLMAQYQEVYQGKMAAALDPESLDAAGGLDAVMQKVTEIEAVQQQRLELEQQLAKTEKGSEEYDATAKAIQDAEDRQKELTAAVEPFKEQLAGVLAAVMAINEQFALLGGTRLDLGELGLTALDAYLNPYHQGSAKDQSYWEQVAAHYEKTGQTQKGYASGTLSAPPGLAWVGENGPELIRMRGGEQVYNAGESIRIAEQTAARAAGGQSAAGSIQVDLGGISISINAGGNSSGGDIVEQIRARLPEIGNELCTMIATQLARTYANMPTKAVEGI